MNNFNDLFKLNSTKLEFDSITIEFDSNNLRICVLGG